MPCLPATIAFRENDFVAFAGRREQARDFLGRVLEVTIHNHYPVAPGFREARGDRRMLAEVPAQPECPHPLVAFAQPLDDRPGPVWTAIVHEHEFPIDYF
jgi:hypothetical protein